MIELEYSAIESKNTDIALWQGKVGSASAQTQDITRLPIVQIINTVA